MFLSHVVFLMFIGFRKMYLSLPQLQTSVAQQHLRHRTTYMLTVHLLTSMKANICYESIRLVNGIM
jgi:hypothetical protein